MLHKFRCIAGDSDCISFVRRPLRVLKAIRPHRTKLNHKAGGSTVYTSFLLSLLLSTALHAQIIVPASPLAPNWTTPHVTNTANSPFQGGFVTTPSSTQLAFSFTLPTSYRQTSAIVDNAAGTMIRTIWNNRAYNAGTYGEIWDGLDDFGNAAAGGPFTVKVTANNVSYNWDGPLFSTGTSWQGPNTWAQNVSAFPPGITFIGNTGYAASGSSENGQIGIFSFDATNPNSGAAPVVRFASGSGNLRFIKTDGSLIYSANSQATSTTTFIQGVWAWSPQGQPYSFSAGTAGPQNQWDNQNSNGSPPVWIGLKAVDASQYNTSQSTGFAVQRGSGTFMATSHGSYTPGAGFAVVASLDLVRIFNKTTGALVNTATVPNPQAMEFDGNNNLWVISGSGTGDVLYEITGVGTSNTVTTPITGLSNPASVTASPTTGNIFILDGGTHQQIYEYNPTTFALVSTLGKLGGYGQGAACNAAVDPGTGSTQNHNAPTFDFDFSTLFGHYSAVLYTTPIASWASVDNSGDLWVGDYPNWRILHYHWNGSAWIYVNRIMGNVDNYYSGTPTQTIGTTGRVWGGLLGLEEFQVNYSQPLLPGDPEAAGGNNSWQGPIRNWVVCIQQSGFNSGTVPQLNDVQTLSNGHTVGNILGALGNLTAVVRMDTDGIVKTSTTSNAQKITYMNGLDGAQYAYSTTGTTPTISYTFKKFPITSFDANGLPIWATTGTNLATYTASHAAGQPFSTLTGQANVTSTWPSVNGLIPILDGAFNADATGNSYHMGLVPVGGTTINAQMRKQKLIEFADGEGSYPAINLAGVAAGGVWAQAFPGSNNIFAMDSFNFQNWGCNFFHYLDDGSMVGQFGWMGSVALKPNALSQGVVGVPHNSALAGTTLAPGFCGDSFLAHMTSVGDEAYFKGIHRWHISGLSSIHQFVGTGSLGGTPIVVQ
jgi:hypothetical protein